MDWGFSVKYKKKAPGGQITDSFNPREKRKERRCHSITLINVAFRAA